MTISVLSNVKSSSIHTQRVVSVDVLDHTNKHHHHLSFALNLPVPNGARPRSWLVLPHLVRLLRWK